MPHIPCAFGPKKEYEVYIVEDASAGVSKQIHKTAIKKMIQAGTRPVTLMQVLLEIQRDWAKLDTYDKTVEIIETYGRAYETGIRYAKNFFQKET